MNPAGLTFDKLDQEKNLRINNDRAVIENNKTALAKLQDTFKETQEYIRHIRSKTSIGQQVIENQERAIAAEEAKIAELRAILENKKAMSKLYDGLVEQNKARNTWLRECWQFQNEEPSMALQMKSSVLKVQEDYIKVLKAKKGDFQDVDVIVLD